MTEEEIYEMQEQQREDYEAQQRHEYERHMQEVGCAIMFLESHGYIVSQPQTHIDTSNGGGANGV